MMNYFLIFVFLIFSLKAFPSTIDPIGPVVNMEWSVHSKLPPPPGFEVSHGFAGSFSGIVNDRLVIAGGTNFPDAPPWEGGNRRYWSDIYFTSAGDPVDWTILPDALPASIAYGVSISLPDGLLMIGGLNEEGFQDGVTQLKMNNRNEIYFETWPSLPVSLAYMTGSVVGNEIYIAGGQTSIDKPSAGKHIFVLDLINRDQGWKSIDAWPGPARSFAVSASQSDGFDNCFYLFSGRDYGPDKDIEVLHDGYEYNPRLGRWKRLDTPEGPQFPVMAGTAFSSGVNHIVFIGGDGGSLMYRQQERHRKLDELMARELTSEVEDSINILRDEIYNHLNTHPGFSRDVLFYHTITNTVAKGGEVPFSVPVTTNLIKFNNKVLVAGGETSPGVRTNEIISGEFIPFKEGLGSVNIIIMVCYFGILVLMGWFFSTRQKSTNDYFRGGGRVPWWAAGLSIFGTSLSAITFMAIPAKAYATDWSYIMLHVGIIAVLPIIVYLFIPFYRKLNITTAYEYLEMRFNVTARVITSIAFILFQIGRMGIVLFLPAIAINVVTGMDIFLCIALMGVFSLIYTMLGGIEAVIWTDALQVVVLLGGAILAVILISVHVDGGFAGVIESGSKDAKFHLADTSIDFTNPTLITVLIATIFINLTTYGTDQTIVQRYLTTSSERNAVRSIWTNAVLTIPAVLIFFFVGTALYVFFKEAPQALSPVMTDPDAIFPWYIFTQMPQGVSGLLIAGIFAAAMSTLSSSMNSSATAYMVDIHFRFGWTGKERGLLLARISTLVLGLAGIIFAILMATWDIKSLWDEFQKILGLVLGGLGGLFLLGLLTRRANGPGAVTGIIGSVFVQVWVSQSQIVHLLLYATTGFISCFILGYIASLVMPKYNKDTDHLTVYELLKNRKTKH